MSRISPILIALISGSTASLSAAQLLNWTNTSGGSASTAGNWSPAAVPGAANTLQFNLVNTYTTTFNSSTPASLGHVYKRGTVTLNVSSPHTAGTSGIIVGDTSGDIATATLSGGSLSTPGTISIAEDAGSTGTFNLSGQTAALATSGTGQLIVGRNGSGEMDITGFSTATIAGNFIAGDNSTATSNVLISGASSIIPFPRSSLIVNGTTASRIGSGGDATFTIASGGRATFAADVIVANGSASTSTISAQGTNLLNLASTLTVGGNLYLGRNVSAVTAAGSGTLSVTNGGRATISGTLFVSGDVQGGTGILSLSDPSSLITCHSLELGSGFQFNHSSGTLRIDGGTLSQTNSVILNHKGGADTANPATIILQNGATFNSTNGSQVGELGAAKLRIESGSSWIHNSTLMTIANNATSTGIVELDGTNSLLQTSNIFVGSNGNGSLLLTNNSQVVTRGIYISRQAGSTGTLLMDHSSMTTIDDIYVGGSETLTGGTATFTLANSSSLTSPAVIVTTGSGTLTATNSTLNVTHTYVNNPSTITDSIINGTAVVLTAPLAASGIINAGIENGTAAITANGPLTLNDGIGPGLNNTPLNVSSHLVTINNGSSPCNLANATIAGGTLNAISEVTIPASATLLGTGNLQGLFNLTGGTITPSTATGLRLVSGAISLSGGTISGTRLELQSGTLLQGGGTCAAAVDAKDHSHIYITSPATIGINAINGFANTGRLTVDSTLTIVDSNGFNLGPDVRLNNGIISSSTQAVFGNPSIASTMVGNGTIAAALSNTGTISPGSDTGDRTGSIAFTRTFITDSVIGAEGNIIIDVEGTSNGQFDMLPCSQFVILGGTVTLRPFNGYIPSNGDRFSFITTPRDISEQFDTLSAPRGWHIEYFQNHTDAVFCAADFNSDGVIDFFDYLDFVAAFSANDPDADFNFDSAIDFFDYLDFVAAFSSGC